MKTYLFWSLLLMSAVFLYKRDQGLHQGHQQMCETIRDNFVEKFNVVDFNQCKDLFHQSFSFSDWEEKTNRWLGTWGWSHLSVYSPQESSAIWESKTQSVGVRLKLIEDQYLVYQAHQESAFKKGDVILSVNGKTEFSLSEALTAGGDYNIERNGERFSLKVSTQDFTWNDEVKFSENLVRIPSFRGEFFKGDQLQTFEQQIQKFKDQKSVYVDLRDNYGGNIAAGLIFLSHFLCEESVVGVFRILSKSDKGKSNYPLVVDQEVQVKHMQNFGEVNLRTPQSEICYKGEVKVLVNHNTSSTAELVAQAFLDFKRGEILGEKTSGRMVLSSWDQIQNFPTGFYFSYPYALYRSQKGAVIEKEGVTPQRYKTYILEKEKKGVDSFLD